MTKQEKDILEEQDILEEMEEELDEIENEEGEIEEEKIEEAQGKIDPEEEKCKDILARTLADFENFKKRTERDKQDMIFFLK
jgi:molecular chaperone GrpE